MELVPSSSISVSSRETSHKDEIFMQQTLKFSDSLKELKNLRNQLYSAAEYFERSDTKDDHQHLVMETLKDYAIKALVNTVDHLGSIASKVDNLLDKKVGEFGRSELQFFCIEQRIRSWNEFNDRQGLSQQSLIIKTPKHHQRYILPEIKIMDGQKASQLYRNDLHQPGNAMALKTRGTISSSFRKLNLASPLSMPYMSPRAFSFVSFASKHGLEKQRVHVQCAQLMRSRSLISRLPFQNSSAAKKRYPSAPGKSNSLVHNAREKKNELEEYSSKTKRLFNALFSMRKARTYGEGAKVDV